MNVFQGNSGQDLYIADTNNYRNRRWVSSTGLVTTVVGTSNPGFGGDGGNGVNAALHSPSAVAVSYTDGTVAIADSANNRIRTWNPSTGIVTTIVGNGAAGFNGDRNRGTSTALNNPQGVLVEGSSGSYSLSLTFSDTNNHRIRIWLPNAGTDAVYTIAGTGVAGYSGDGGEAITAQLNAPSGIAQDW